MIDDVIGFTTYDDGHDNLVIIRADHQPIAIRLETENIEDLRAELAKLHG